MSRMKGFLCTATFLLLATLAGCGGARLFAKQELPVSPGVAEAPWPRLVDTPAVPAPTEVTPRDDIATELNSLARAAELRAAELAKPVLSDAERRRLTRKR
jgi:hypothetical protein